MPGEVKSSLEGIASRIYDYLVSGEVPEISMPSRNRDNIALDPMLSVWKYGESQVTRSGRTTDGAEYMVKILYMIDFIREMLQEGKSSTLREMYYISEGWNLGKFHTQDESNLMAEDLEVISALLREDFRLRPEENGASIMGNITVEEKTRKGEFKKINCKDDVGDSGYSIPYSVEDDKFHIKDVDADFILAIETGGMFDRLVENGFDESNRCLLVHLKGQPARSTRRLLKRINEERGVPVVVFTDGDPWSFRIYASIAYGAIKTAHISHYLAVPTAEFIGVTASDILNYDLPTDKLNDKDIAALNAELKDPRFNSEMWRDEIETMLRIGKKAEQQALAKYGLNYVTSTYLPEKLSQINGNRW